MHSEQKSFKYVKKLLWDKKPCEIVKENKGFSQR